MNRLNITVTIKLKPYLRQYAEHHYGNPIVATTKNKLFTLLLPYITKTLPDYKGELKGDDYVKVYLPDTHYLNILQYNYVSPNHFGMIQAYFHGLFHVHFITELNKTRKQGMQLKTSIINFMLANGLTFDEAKYDSLKRIYLRHRRKVEIKSNKFMGGSA